MKNIIIIMLFFLITSCYNRGGFNLSQKEESFIKELRSLNTNDDLSVLLKHEFEILDFPVPATFYPEHCLTGKYKRVKFRLAARNKSEDSFWSNKVSDFLFKNDLLITVAIMDSKERTPKAEISIGDKCLESNVKFRFKLNRKELRFIKELLSLKKGDDLSVLSKYKPRVQNIWYPSTNYPEHYAIGKYERIEFVISMSNKSEEFLRSRQISDFFFGNHMEISVAITAPKKPLPKANIPIVDDVEDEEERD